MAIVDAFTHQVALNPVPHCNAYYAYTTIYEHWIAKFGLPETLVTSQIKVPNSQIRRLEPI